MVYVPGSSDLEFGVSKSPSQGFRGKNSLHEGILKREHRIMERALTLKLSGLIMFQVCPLLSVQP